MKTDLLIVARTEPNVGLAAGLEAIDLATLARAVDIADDRAAEVIRSYGFPVCRSGEALIAAGRQVYHAPRNNPAVEKLYAQCSGYLLERGLAFYVSPKRIAL